jgi:protoporphyrinogen oxidase
MIGGGAAGLAAARELVRSGDFNRTVHGALESGLRAAGLLYKSNSVVTNY